MSIWSQDLETLTTTEQSTPSYKKRYIAFLDIMGFSNLVKKTLTEKGYLEGVVEACKQLEEHKKFNEKPLAPVKSKSRTYMFSDSICHTVEPTPDGLVELINDVAMLCVSLIYRGVFVRGAVVLGQVYEDGQVIFGPGLIDAYENESKAAKYPRVLVSNDIYESSQSIDYVVGGREPMRLKECIRRDFDGLYHVNWLCHLYKLYKPGAKGFPTDGPLDYESVKNVVQYWLRESKERVDIQSKVQWFAGYFNEVIVLGKELNILGPHGSLSAIEY